MHGLKKFIFTLCLLFAFSTFTTFAEKWPDDVQEVFDINLNGERIALGISTSDYMCAVFFFNESKTEVIGASLSTSEYDKLVNMTLECKLLMESISTLEEYESKNIYKQIVKKIKKLAPIPVSMDYDESEEFGPAIWKLYTSQTLFNEYKEYYLSGSEN